MADKIGVCEGCEARYKIPPTFTGTKAKCKKCGGVVHVQDASGEGEPAAPASKPAARKPAAGAASGESAGRGSRSGGGRGAGGRAGAGGRGAGGRRAGAASGRRGGRGRGDAEAGGEGAGGRRGRRAAAKSGGSNTLLWAGLAGVLILGGGAGAYFMMGGDDDSTDTASAASGAGDSGAGDEATDSPSDAPVESTPAEESSTPEADPGDDSGAGDDTTEASTDDAGADADEGSEDSGSGDEAASDESPAEVATLIEFDTFDRTESTTDEEWEAITAAVEGMQQGGRARKRNMDKLVPFGLKALPAVINTLNGTDLSDSIAWADAFEVAMFIQNDLTYTAISVPFKGDYSDDPTVIDYNYKALNSLVDYWKNCVENPSSMERAQAKYEEKKAAADSGSGE